MATPGAKNTSNVQGYELGVRADHFLSMRHGRAEPETDIFIGIRGNEIADILAWDPDLEKNCREFYYRPGQAVIPGLINGHTHLPMTLFRGLSDDEPLRTWLFERILPIEAKLVDRDFVRVGAELAILESIRFGVTTVSDMYFYAIEIGEAIDRAGMRGVVSQTFVDAPLPEDRELGTDKVALFRRLDERFKGHGRVRAALGPHAPYTCGDATFRRVGELSHETGALIHTHLCETANEVQESLAQYGKTPVQRLYDLGALTQKTVAAHSVHFTQNDFEIFKRSGASVVHNPDSNAKLGSGVAPLGRFKQLGIYTALGTDGSASNNDLSLFGAMDLATKLQKLVNNDNTAMVAADALRAATWGGAHALGLQDQVGSIEVGKRADLVWIDLNYPHMQPLLDLRSQLVYAAQGLEVDSVLCDGKFLLRQREFVTMDLAQVMARVAPWQKRVSEAAHSLG